MNAGDYDELRRLFLTACDLGPDEQRAFLERLGATPVRHRLASLLAHDGSDAGLSGPWLPDVAEARAGATPPPRVGRYRLVRPIGQGGMGAVWEAEQDAPRRTVALKLLHPALLSPATRRRFQYEAELLGRLQHPGIAQILEADVATGNGGAQPFIAMELVDGVPINAFAAAHALDPSRRLELVRRVCAALQHAHQRGVLHRDLKPSNILVTPAGRPKLLDFGVATTLAADAFLTTLHTRPGQLVGTVPYMSPEQAAGDAAAADVRSDVYALGVLLFELVSGRLPFDVRGRALHEVVRRIREEPTPRLSAVLDRVDPDLETIVGTAMARDTEQRYGSVAALDDDLQSFLARRPITARPPTRGYRLRKWMQRNRLLAASAAAVALALVVGAAGTTIGLVAAGERARLAAEAEQAASDEAEASDEVTRFLEDMLTAISPDELGRDVRVLDILDLAAVNVDSSSMRSPTRIRLHTAIGLAYRAIGSYENSTEHLQRALTLAHEHYGAEQLQTLDLELAVEAGPIGETPVSASLDRLRDLVSRCERITGNGSPQYLEAMALLASALRDSGELTASREMYEQIVAVHRASRIESESGCYAEVDLASLCALQGDLDLAVALLERILHAPSLSAGCWRAATSELGPIYYHLGRLDDAEAVLRDLLATTDRDSVDNVTLSAKGTLALVYVRQERFDEAESLLLDLLSTHRSQLGDYHVTTTTVLNNLALLYSSCGRDALAREIWEGLAVIITDSLGPEHPYTLLAYNNLATACMKAGRWGEAGHLLATAVAIQTECLGLQHRDTLRTIDTLAYLLSRCNRVDEAELYWNLVVEQMAASDSRTIAYYAAVQKLCISLRNRGRFSECIALTSRAIASARQQLPGHSVTGALVQLQGRALADLGRTEEAERCFIESALMTAGSLGTDHRRTRDVLMSLHDLYLQIGDDERARAVEQLFDGEERDPEQLCAVLEPR